MRRHMTISLVVVASLLLGSRAFGQDAKDEAAKARAKAMAKGLEWLTKNQGKDGAWGGTHSIAVASWAILDYLAASNEPFDGDNSKALHKAIEFLLANQKDGMFSAQGHSWIHGQGFATLALSETYGRSLFCKTKPDLDMKKVKEVVTKGIKIIAENQSNSGGWWYTVGDKNNHEGSTTVCAVQALASAKNFGIPIDEKVLEKGFDYLKKCQTKEGGFNYRLGDGSNMKEGTAAAVATLGLMEKFDFQVMISGYEFLLKTTPAVISRERFPFYGHFYGSMGMHLLWQEYKVDKNYSSKTKGYLTEVHKDVISWQQADGSFPPMGWVKENNQDNSGYSTAFGVLVLSVPDSRLSIFNRDPPKLPKER